MERQAIKALVQELHAKHDVEHVKVVYGTAKNRSGVYYPYRNLIRYSLPILEQWPEEEVRDTILHEIAHVKAPEDIHGPVWKSVAASIGANPERTSDTPYSVSFKWKGICPNGHVRYRHRRPRNGGARSCGKCYPVFSTDYLLHWYENDDTLVPNG